MSTASVALKCATARRSPLEDRQAAGGAGGRRRQLVVTAAGGKQRGGGSGSKQRRDSGGGKQAQKQAEQPKARSKALQMTEFKADEILMFDPVPASRGALQVVYAYPNEYTVGITSLGYQLVWAFFETRPDVAVHRLFTDAYDQLPASADLLGFSFSWELDYSNILSMLEQLGIPLLAAERGDEHPLVRPATAPARLPSRPCAGTSNPAADFLIWHHSVVTGSQLSACAATSPQGLAAASHMPFHAMNCVLPWHPRCAATSPLLN